MKDILLIGGMGSGKTTLTDALLAEDPGLNYLYGSKYSVRIPMSLIDTTNPDLLSLPKTRYIETIKENRDIELVDFPRHAMDEFGRLVTNLYGDTILAEMYLHVAEDNVQNLFDSLPTVANVKLLKEHGVYVVGLDCKPKTQVQRRLDDRKEIDPTNRSSLEKQVRDTNNYFEIETQLALAHRVYDTDVIRESQYPQLARKILQATR